MNHPTHPEAPACVEITAAMWQALSRMPHTSQLRVLRHFMRLFFPDDDPAPCPAADRTRVELLRQLWENRKKIEIKKKEEATPTPPQKKEINKERKKTLVNALTRTCESEEKISGEPEGLHLPTLDEVRQHIRLCGYRFSAERFHAYYTARHWIVDGRVRTDWQTLCHQWQSLTPAYEQRHQRDEQRRAEAAWRAQRERIAALERERQNAEFDRRYEENRRQCVTYEQYLRLKEEGTL